MKPVLFSILSIGRHPWRKIGTSLHLSLSSDFGLTLKGALMDASSAAAAVQGQKGRRWDTWAGRAAGGPSLLASSKEGRVRIKRAR